MSSKIDQMVNIPQLSKRAESYGLKGVTIDGNDLIAVLDTTYQGIEEARKGNGPMMIEALTYRFKGHSKSDERIYRTKEEELRWEEERDPIKLTEKLLTNSQVASNEELMKLKKQAFENVQKAVQEAEKSEDIELSDLTTQVYAE